jgi:hypothetical protein
MGTTFATTTSFPTNRHIIETSGATDGSFKYATLYLSGISMHNLANFDTKNIGGIKFETDYSARRRQLIIDGFYGQYLHKGLTLQGPLWFSYFNNMNFETGNATFIGDYDIKLEQTGTYTHTTAGVNNWPKANHFNNIISIRTVGATMTNSLYIDAGGYNTFNNYMVDGSIYTNSVFRFGSTTGSSCDNNTMYLPWSLDNTEQGGQVGCLLIDGSNTYNNRFINSRFTRNQYMLAIKNSAYRNYVQLAGYWGAGLTIDNVGCGEYNVLEVMHGSLAAATPPSKMLVSGSSTDNAKIRITDNRKGAYNQGVSTQSGNASTTAFNIAHGLFTTPLTYSVTPQTVDARGTPAVTATSTNLVLTYPVAPPTGTNNLTWVWTAGVY